jgi:hypothetical protein
MFPGKYKLKTTMRQVWCTQRWKHKDLMIKANQKNDSKTLSQKQNTQNKNKRDGDLALVVASLPIIHKTLARFNLPTPLLKKYIHKTTIRHNFIPINVDRIKKGENNMLWTKWTP